MTTMYQKCMGDLVEKIAAQAVEMAFLKEEIADLENKLQAQEKQRKVEREHREQTALRNAYLQREADNLRTEVETLQSRVPAEFSLGHMQNLEGMIDQARQERDQAEQRANALEYEVAQLRQKLADMVLVEIAS